jgi:hypothetical protein
LSPLLLKKLHSIVEETAPDYAPHALVAVRENAKGVKAVVKMDAKQHVVAGVVKDVKAVAMQCAKATV